MFATLKSSPSPSALIQVNWVKRRMVIVVNFFVFLNFVFFALLLIHVEVCVTWCMM